MERASGKARQRQRTAPEFGHSHGRHMCAFFHSAEEEYKALLPFIKDGFAHVHKALHVVDPNLRDDIAAAEQRGQFELRNWADAYPRDGRFDQDRMLALISEVLEGGRQHGYPLTRMVAHMEWAMDGRPGVEDLVEHARHIHQRSRRHSNVGEGHEIRRH
jgi:hypothetical protein